MIRVSTIYSRNKILNQFHGLLIILYVDIKMNEKVLIKTDKLQNLFNLLFHTDTEICFRIKIIVWRVQIQFIVKMKPIILPHYFCDWFDNIIWLIIPWTMVTSDLFSNLFRFQGNEIKIKKQFLEGHVTYSLQLRSYDELVDHYFRNEKKIFILFLCRRNFVNNWSRRFMLTNLKYFYD